MDKIKLIAIADDEEIGTLKLWSEGSHCRHQVSCKLL